MSETKQVGSGRLGFLSLLALLFIGLKLTGFIDWSWVWVLAPLWVVPAILVGILVAGGLAAAVLTYLDKRNRRKWQQRARSN